MVESAAMKLPALLLCLCLVACGGSSSPTRPTVVTPTPTPTPAPTPAPAPAPTFPVMTGGWGGTWTQVSTGNGLNGTATCTHTWIITSQTAGAFGGTYQSSSSATSTCAEAGTISGTVSTSGAVTLGFGGGNGLPAGCVRTAEVPVYAGVVSTSGNMTMQSRDVWRCTLAGTTADVTRNLTLSMSKR